MASASRTPEREEERRLNMRTLVIASAASASAAAVTSQLWFRGTWIAAAVTPVLVALLSELLHRPTEKIARVWTTGERDALMPTPDLRPPEEPGGSPTPPPRAGGPKGGLPVRGPQGGPPVRVYRQPSPRQPRRRLALGVVAGTAALAFVIAAVAITVGELVAGGSIAPDGGRTSLTGDGRSGDGEKTEEASPTTPEQPEERPQEDEAPSQPAEPPAPATPPEDEPPAEEPPPTTTPTETTPAP